MEWVLCAHRWWFVAYYQPVHYETPLFIDVENCSVVLVMGKEVLYYWEVASVSIQYIQCMYWVCKLLLGVPLARHIFIFWLGNTFISVCTFYYVYTYIGPFIWILFGSLWNSAPWPNLIILVWCGRCHWESMLRLWRKRKLLLLTIMWFVHYCILIILTWPRQICNN